MGRANYRGLLAQRGIIVTHESIRLFGRGLGQTCASQVLKAPRCRPGKMLPWFKVPNACEDRTLLKVAYVCRLLIIVIIGDIFKAG